MAVFQKKNADRNDRDLKKLRQTNFSLAFLTGTTRCSEFMKHLKLFSKASDSGQKVVL
jgi:hypothetical protein